MLKAIIFDFDGLIIDTESTEFQTWQEIYSDLGAQLSLEKWVTGIGLARSEFDPYSLLEETCGHRIDKQSIRSRFLKRANELNAELKVLPGVTECILAAKESHIKIAIASSSDRKWIESHLKRLGLLEYFDKIGRGYFFTQAFT